jgi:hypothetical protein
MLVNKRYIGIISSIEKSGRGFTSTSGTKYLNYAVTLEGNVSKFQLSLPITMILEAGDEIKFTLKVDKKKMLRLTDVEIVSYDLKYPLKTQPSDLII